MEVDEYRKLSELQDRLWWFLGMREISEVLLRRFLGNGSSEMRILDAGCGSGSMLCTLRAWGRTTGLDESVEAIRLARQRVSSPLVRADVSKLPFAAESFDVVTSFDVLYHARVKDDEAAMLEMARVLRANGLLLVRVPAINFLRGRHDIAVHTRHRYGKRELIEKLARTGFLVQFVSFVNFILLPVAVLRRGTEKWRAAKSGSEVEPLPDWLNRALYRAMWMEARWIRFAPLPVGLSLVAVARRGRS